MKKKLENIKKEYLSKSDNIHTLRENFHTMNKAEYVSLIENFYSKKSNILLMQKLSGESLILDNEGFKLFSKWIMESD